MAACKQSSTGYHKCLLASIERVKGFTTEQEPLELNKNQCKYLSDELQELVKFLQREEVKKLILGHNRFSKISKALLQLYSVVKRAENLVQQCRPSKGSPWPKRALTLFAMKDDVLDVMVHLRWWTAILSMVIGFPSSHLSKPERVKRANEEFEQGLISNDLALETAAREDGKQLLNKVNEEMPAGLVKHYNLLVLQVRALLIDTDEHSTTQLNEYKPDGRNALVGQGSFGVVTKVTWLGFNCVLKQYNTPKVEDVEVDSLKKFHHPHIVRFFRHWEEENFEKYKSHILMERMEKDLQQHIESEMQSESGQTGPFSKPVAIDIMLQVINAIRHMHDKGIVHRDLKPGNVLIHSKSESVLPELSAQGYLQVKLGDFGIAKPDMMTSNAASLTHKAGTTSYRAPELASKDYIRKGSRKFPFKIDMWSFGIMCSQILTGQKPFKGKEGNALQVFVEDGGRPSIPDDCPDYLRFCIEKCWEYDPEKRPRSCDLWRMLRVAQLRILGLIDQNYDLFSFKDHSNAQVSLGPAPGRPGGEQSQSYRSLAPVNQESISSTEEAIPDVVPSIETYRPEDMIRGFGGEPVGLQGFLQGWLFK